MRVLELAMARCWWGCLGLWMIGVGWAAVSGAEPESGFRSLFNGRDLSGWHGLPGFWSVEEGAITGRTTRERPAPGNTFLMWTGGRVRDFELRLRYRIVPNNPQGFANSGIQYRSRLVDRTNVALAGYQADIDAGPNYSGILYEERGRGIMALRGEQVRFTPENRKEVTGRIGDAAAIQAAIRTNDWNEYVIIAEGNRLRHYINGHLTVDVTDESPRGAREGLLGFQLHVGEPMTVQFRDIRLKVLPAEKR